MIGPTSSIPGVYVFCQGGKSLQKEIIEEKQRRKTLAPEERKTLRPLLDWALEYAGVAGDRTLLTDEQRSVRNLVYKLTTGSAEKNDPDALVYNIRFRAWIDGAVPEWVKQQQEKSIEVWNAIARHYQHELSIVREQYNAIATQEGLDEKQQKELRKQVDFSKLKKLITDTPVVFDKAISLRKTDVAASTFEQWLAAQLPVEQLRNMQDRLLRAIHNRQGKAWDEGYPQIKENKAPDWTLDLHFNGQNLDMVNWFPEQTAANSYAIIGPQCDPPGHHGRRKGLKRRERQMRQITVCVPGPGETKRSWKKGTNDTLVLNVLIHDPASLPSKVKAILISVRDGEWWVNLTVERTSSTLPSVSIDRKFAGVDVRWRKKSQDELSVVHWVTSDGSYREESIRLTPNRRSRRWNNPDLPAYVSTRAGVREFQTEISKRKDQIKEVISQHYQQHGLSLPAGWGTAGKKGMSKAVLQANNESLSERWQTYFSWDAKALHIYRRLCADISNRLESEYRRIAQTICENKLTDIGIEDLSVKEIADTRRKQKMTPEEKAIDKVSQRNRQDAAPGKFLEILSWTARKRGIRVHKVNPWMTTRRCFWCGNENPSTIEEIIVCGGCGKRLHLSENASRNIAMLARECSDDDGNPRSCSRDGKSNPYVVLSGFSTQV
jgi:Putative transposase DNA-binding domain